MNLKDILIHIDHRQTCTSRLEVALKLAAQQQAVLTGIYIIPHLHYLTPASDQEADARNAEELFRAKAEAAGVESDWICIDSKESGLDIPEAINLYAHYRDLLIVSQTDQSKADVAIPDNLPEKAILGSGRPVLVVPYTGDFNHEIKRTLVAWRGGSESARALHDSMPLLRKCDRVNVITVLGQYYDEVNETNEADICKHMSRYDLPLTCEKRKCGDLSVGDLLLNRCAEYGADLLIMGATSHMRRGYLTVGKTARHILKHMTTPVIISH